MQKHILILIKPEKITSYEISYLSLSKFMGCYDKWKDIKDKYQLKSSNVIIVLDISKILSNQ